ncbi:MAG: fibronectin type III domain-containing protein, partial [Anaerolineae bacterium]|nr:fibronectin type III domain-containing protein [Anaerolineae bacterium]
MPTTEDFYFVTAPASGPGAFNKDTPLNAAGNLPTSSLTLRWFPSSGATGYLVCVGTSAGSCNALPGNTWLNVGAVTQTVVTNLAPGTTYFWQVMAVNANGQTLANAGTWWRFTTQGAPSALGTFNKMNPTHMLTGVATNTLLSWDASANASHYSVCVGTQPGLCDVMDNVTTTLTSLTLQGAEPGKT